MATRKPAAKPAAVVVETPETVEVLEPVLMQPLYVAPGGVILSVADKASGVSES